jgi:hypothetical protein
MTAFPPALHLLAIASLSLAAGCAVTIALDEIRRPQKMGVMNFVWPLTALFGSVIWLAGYYRWGRSAPAGADSGNDHAHGHQDAEDAPFAVSVATGASHCGAGCTLGDIVAEWLAFGVPAVAVWSGWGTVFADKMVAVWVPDFLLAFLFGIVFQYWSIKPMRDLTVGQGVVAALKADIASITAWQVGMYAAMAAIQLLWFRPAYSGTAAVDTPEFWFAMQLAMLAGFGTSYPINWLLIRAGVKERM